MEVEDRSADTEICTGKGVGPSALVIGLSILQFANAIMGFCYSPFSSTKSVCKKILKRLSISRSRPLGEVRS